MIQNSRNWKPKTKKVNYYLGLDLGSSSIKVALVEVDSGKSIGVVQEPKEEKVTTQYQKLSGPKITGQKIDLTQFNKPKKKTENKMMR